MARILVLEDDRATAMMLAIFIKALGHTVQTAIDGSTGLEILRAEPPDVVISDMLMEPMGGLEFLTQLRAEQNLTPVMMFSGANTVEATKRALDLGATDFLSKPLKLDEIRRCLDRALNVPEKQNEPAKPAASLADELAVLLPGAGYERTRQALAPLGNRTRALLEAEPGMLGRELLEVIHAHGSASDGPLVIHHLGKVPIEEALPGLLDEKGLPGTWFRVSAKGTLVLLALERLPMPVQKNLNTALRKYTGGHVIASTLSDPDSLVAQGRLDEGLFFRLSTFSLRLPPVRELDCQTGELFRACLAAAPGYVFGSIELEIEETVARAIGTYSWPENIAELRHVAASTVASLRTPHVTMAQLPERFFKVRMPTLAEALVSAQTQHILRAHRILGGAPLDVAGMLEIPLQQVEAVLAGAHEPLFELIRPGAADPATKPAAAAPAAHPADSSLLIVIADPVLRAAAAACIPECGLRVRTQRDALGALAVAAARPDRYGKILLVGADGLFTTEEIAGQFKRIVPQAKFAALPAHTAGPAMNVADLEEAISRLLPTAA